MQGYVEPQHSEARRSNTNAVGRTLRFDPRPMRFEKNSASLEWPAEGSYMISCNLKSLVIPMKTSSIAAVVAIVVPPTFSEPTS